MASHLHVFAKPFDLFASSIDSLHILQSQVTMKVRRFMVWSCAGTVVLLALVFWLENRRAESPSPASGAQDHVRTVQLQPEVGKGARSGSAGPDASVRAVPLQDKKQQVHEGLAALNSVPIVFYGKLDDQFGSPVAGAEVTGTTIVYNGMGAHGQRVVAKSDENGLFEIKAGSGESLGIMPRKSGYVLAGTNTDFKYSGFYPRSRHVPDQNNPVVVRMWKLQGAEPLVGFDKHYALRITGSPISIDLLAGKVVPTGGDIRIAVQRAEGIVSERQPQDWSLKVEAVEGGLIETSFTAARVTYQAPESGYMPSASFVFSTNPPYKWFGGFDQMLYLTSRGGRVFAKLLLSFRINQSPDAPASLTLHGVANANGSRNWEATAPD